MVAGMAKAHRKMVVVAAMDITVVEEAERTEAWGPGLVQAFPMFHLPLL
jgi:hypothetical protein